VGKSPLGARQRGRAPQPPLRHPYAQVAEEPAETCLPATGHICSPRCPRAHRALRRSSRRPSGIRLRTRARRRPACRLRVARRAAGRDSASRRAIEWSRSTTPRTSW
jgi:hypothetical protein